MARIRVAILLMGAMYLVFAFDGVEQAEAHLPLEPLSPDFCGYLQKNASDNVCQADADPINVVFVNGTLQEVLEHFEHHLGWHSPAPSGNFYFQDHGSTDLKDDERKTFGLSDQHIRFEEGAHCQPVCYVLGAAHRDRFVAGFSTGCPPVAHAGEQFNQTRNLIAEAFEQGGHAVRTVTVGNSAALTQCDGSVPSSDGQVAVIETDTSVTVTSSGCGASCVDFNFTVVNDEGGRPVEQFIVTFHVSPGFVLGFPFGTAPAGWQASGKGGGGTLFGFGWEADSARFGIRMDKSLSGFVIRSVGTPLCPFNVDWLASDRNGGPLDSGSLVAPCPPTVSGQILFGTDGGRLASVDPSTGEVTFVGPIGFQTACCLAVDPSGLLFGLHGDPDKPAPQLIAIDPSTGLGTAVVDVPSEISGLAIDSSGTLFSFGLDLVTLNPSTGAATFVAPLGLPAQTQLTDVAFDASDTLYGAVFEPASGPPDDIPGGPASLIMIDTATGQGTTVGTFDPPVSFMSGIAFDASGVLFGVTCELDPKLVTIDPLTAQLTVVGSLSLPVTCVSSLVAFAP